MKQMLFVPLLLCTSTTVFAQTKNNDVVKRETTTVTTTTTTTAPPVSASPDLLGLETFNFLDATTIPEGTVDLRLAGRWIQTKETGDVFVGAINNPWNDDDDDDQWILIPEIVWGASERYEMTLSVPTWVQGDPEEGNYDSYVSGQWRITDVEETCPAVALYWQIRVPTGDGSNGVDGQLRLILTHEFENNVRSHFNIWGTSVNTDNYPDARDFQYGAVLGLDGPLNCDGTLRWVFDYMWEISHQEGVEADLTYYPYPRSEDRGGENRNTAEAGIQWQINECSKLGFAVQGGLDHAENETPEWAASVTYSYTIGN